MYTNVYPGVSGETGGQTVGEKEGVSADIVLAMIPLPLQIDECFVKVEVTERSYPSSVQEVYCFKDSRGAGKGTFDKEAVGGKYFPQPVTETVLDVP